MLQRALGDDFLLRVEARLVRMRTTGDTSLAPDALIERVERSGCIALRCPIPGHRFRETIIVPRAGESGTDEHIFADWYAQEDLWLDWVLAQLGHPSFNSLILELTISQVDPRSISHTHYLVWDGYQSVIKWYLCSYTYCNA